MKKNNKHIYLLKKPGISICIVVFLYLILLIPESPPTIQVRASNQPFLWDQDSLWFSLEAQFMKARQTGCGPLSDPIDKSFLKINDLLITISAKSLQPEAQEFSVLEDELFRLAPLIAACQHRLSDYIELSSKLRYLVKSQSHHWDMNAVEARQTIYRLLYGSRTAIEEVMLQANQEDIPLFVVGHEEPSQTPSANFIGMTIHSGDILASRGGAPTSALIARGNDYPGNFSHIALVHVDENTHLASVIEAHIEGGVKISTMDEYLKDKKLRVMILRLRSDLPQLIIDPMLPHKSATSAINEALTRHIPYDFEMNYQDNTKLFCSEVASAAYQKFGVNLWMGISSISSAGITRWLSLFGVKYFETQEPSDLEYDPQLRVVAEWRDPETLLKDHIDNAVIEVMLERAESGKELSYSRCMLPVARIAKLYSTILNIFGFVGPIPEGMSATAALRNQRLTEDHDTIRDKVESLANAFKKQHKYTVPYWQLLKFTKKTMSDLSY